MTADPHSLLAPFVLDALDPDEREEFELHLADCETCRAEASGFEETAARIGAAESHTPPPRVRELVLAAAHTTGQEMPVVSVLAHRRQLRRFVPRLAIAGVFLVGATAYIAEHNSANDYQSANESITAVLSAADASTNSSALKDGGTLRMVASPSRDAAVLVADGLASLPEGKVYQVWMIKAGVASPKGTFDTHTILIVKNLAAAKRMAVTIEPKGGSTSPTSPPIVTLAI